MYYLLHRKREITMKGIAKIIDYIMSHLPMTWDHPFYPMRTTKVAILLVKTPQINIVLVHLWYSPVNTSDKLFSIYSSTTDFPHRIKSSQLLQQMNTRKCSPTCGSGWWYPPRPANLTISFK